MNDWINSPIITTLAGAVIGAIAGGASSYFFGLKRDEKIRNVENSNKELKRKDEELEQRQKKDSEGIRAEIKELLKEQEKRVRTEEELKTLKILYDGLWKDRDRSEARVKELENINTKLRLKLSNHGIKEEDADTDDTPWHEWEKKNRRW